MRTRKSIFLYSLLIFIALTTLANSSVNAEENRIRGRVVGYVWDSLWLVRTTKNEYVVLRRNSTIPSNPVPEAELRKKRVWSFAVKPDNDCKFKMSVFRFDASEIGFCGTEASIVPEEPKAPKITAIQYPLLSYLDPSYKAELDLLTNETALRCFTVDLEETTPSFNERFANGVVLGTDGEPLQLFQVSIGYAHAQNRLLYVLTDEHGRFSIPIWEQFSYWIRPGETQFVGSYRYKPVIIPRKKQVAQLTLRLEVEDQPFQPSN